MAEPGALDYFYGTEAEQYTFYRIPKVLFTDPGFRRITADAKILYGLMLYMGHVVERCADRSTGRLLQISYVVHVVLIPAFFL